MVLSRSGALALAIVTALTAPAAAQTAPAAKPIYPLKASAAPTPFQGAGALHCQLDSPGANPALMLFSTDEMRRLGFFADEFKAMIGSVQAMVTYPNGITESLLLTRKGKDMLMIELTPEAQGRFLDNIAAPGKVLVRVDEAKVAFPLNDPAPAVATMRGCVSHLQAKLGRPTTLASDTPQPPLVVYSQAVTLAQRGDWSDALRTVATSTNRDKVDVLLIFAEAWYRGYLTEAGADALIDNWGVMAGASLVASPTEKLRLDGLQNRMFDYARQRREAGIPSGAAPARPSFGSPSAPSSTSVRTNEAPRCYQVSRDRQVCYN